MPVIGLDQETVDQVSLEIEELMEDDDPVTQMESPLGRLLTALPDSEYGEGVSPFHAEINGQSQ